MSRVTFNVGGTRFETRRSTIERIEEQDDLLNMLLRHNQEEEEIFIDREPAFFNDILRIYRNGGFYADPSKGKDSKEWLDALDYYGLKFLLPQGPEKVVSFRAQVEKSLVEQKREHLKRKRQQEEAWKDKAAVLFHLLDQEIKLQFVTVDRPPLYPDSSKQIEHQGKVITMEWIESNRLQLQAYARELGYFLNFSSSREDTRDSFEFRPAKSLFGLTRRKKSTLTLEFQYLVT